MIPNLTNEKLEERLNLIVQDAENLGKREEKSIFNLNGGQIYHWSMPTKLSGHDARIIGSRFKKMVKEGKVNHVLLLYSKPSNNPNIDGKWMLGSKDAEYKTY